MRLFCLIQGLNVLENRRFSSEALRKSMGKVRIISIGYEDRQLDDFLNVLNKYKVKKLLDVRGLPLSRRKGFSKTSLSLSLNRVGVKYIHVKAAGNPYRKEKGNIQRCLALYSKYLQKHPEAISGITDEFSSGTIAVMCYEKDHEKCHRSILLDQLQKECALVLVVEAN